MDHVTISTSAKAVKLASCKLLEEIKRYRKYNKKLNHAAETMQICSRHIEHIEFSIGKLAQLPIEPGDFLAIYHALGRLGTSMGSARATMGKASVAFSGGATQEAYTKFTKIGLKKVAKKISSIEKDLSGILFLVLLAENYIVRQHVSSPTPTNETILLSISIRTTTIVVTPDNTSGLGDVATEEGETGGEEAAGGEEGEGEREGEGEGEGGEASGEEAAGGEEGGGEEETSGEEAADGREEEKEEEGVSGKEAAGGEEEEKAAECEEGEKAVEDEEAAGGEEAVGGGI